MLGYPYNYNDCLSEEEAMKRRVEIFDKGLVLLVLSLFWSLIPTAAFADNLPKTNFPGSAVDSTPSPTPAPVFAPIAGVCSCASPQVKTAILLIGVSSICYSALCSKDKPLIVACTSMATYVAANLIK